MSLKLSSYPVSTNPDGFLNGFAGFQDLFIEFKREDQAITGITSGTDSKIRIAIPIDLSASISVGDSVYIYSPTTDFIYDNSAPVLVVDTTYIEIDIDYIEDGTAGYINYLKNWYCEIKIVSDVNNNADLLGYLLTDAGKPNGEIKINLIDINNKNTIELITASGNQENSRIKFEIKFKQVYTGSSESYQTINTSLGASYYDAGLDSSNFIPIFVVYATEDFNLDEFHGEAEILKIYKGYPAYFSLTTSEENHLSYALLMEFDELDINKNVIGGTADQLINNFSSGDYGLQVGVINDMSTFNANTKYIQIKGSYVSGADFNSSDFNNSDFSV